MSNIKNEVTENNISQQQLNTQNYIITNISNKSEKVNEIKSQNNKYKYNYSNNNNIKKNNNISNNKKNNNISRINIESIKSNKISISPNKKGSKSPSKLNCETKYSINKMTNTYYVNGLNKNISKENSQRSPDLRFIPYENKEIYEKKNIMRNNLNKKCICKKIGLYDNINENIQLNENSKYYQQFIDKEFNKTINNKYSSIQSWANRREYNNEDNITIVNASKRNNHNFRSISNCSKKSRTHDNSRNSSNEGKYKCDIKIHNINNNIKKETIRSFSSQKKMKKRSSSNTKVFISEKNQVKEDLEYKFNRHKSFDKKYLKMQNSQNMQILQEEKLYKILIPIPPNETDHICQFQIPAKDILKNNLSDKQALKEIISENENDSGKIKQKELFNKKIKYKRKTSWNKNNSPNRKKNKNINCENLSKASEKTDRQFKGEMQIESSKLNFERSPRKWNENLQPNNDEHFSIERQKKKDSILSETSVEKLTYKCQNVIKSPNKNWNELNNKEKAENINLIPEKSPRILSQQNKELFSIIGQQKQWNNIILKKDENNFIIKANKEINQEEKEEKEKKEENEEKDEKEENEENEEKTIINDDDIDKEIKRNIRVITNKIKNGLDTSETSSEYDILKKINPLNNNKYENIIKNSFEQNINKRKVIINDMNRHFPSLNNGHFENNKNNIQIRKVIHNVNNLQFINQTNLKSDFPEPEIILNPHYEENKSEEGTEYNYRESITNKELYQIEKVQKELTESKNKSIIDDEKDILESPTDTKTHNEKNSNIEDTLSQTFSPKSQMRYEYREEIISLSPRYRGSRTKIINDINKNENKNENENDCNFMEEEYKSYTSNMEKYEQEIEKEIVEEKIIQSETEIGNNNLLDNNQNNDNKQKKPKIYICKNKTNKFNKNNKKQYKQTTDNQQINEIIQINSSNITFKNNDSIKDSNRTESNYDINYPEEEKTNPIITEESKENLNGENMINNENNNIIQENNNNFIIYNSQKIKKNNDIKTVNENIFLRSNGLSKSQHIKNGINVDNQNKKFGNISKISLGNIVINNTLIRKNKNEAKNEIKNETKTEIKNETKTEIKNEIKNEVKGEIKSEKENENEKENEEANLIHHFENKKKEINTGNGFKQNPQNRVKIIKK